MIAYDDSKRRYIMDCSGKTIISRISMDSNKMFFISDLSEKVTHFWKGRSIMKLAHYVTESKTRVGMVKEGRIFDLANSGLQGFAELHSIDDLLSQGKLDNLLRSEQNLYNGPSLSLNSTKLLSPVFHPQKIYCAAINYLSHSKEQDVKPPTEPYFFTKFGNTLIGPDDPILIPRSSKKVDWEVELAVVIGRKGKYIKKDEAMGYVAGYTISNDISYRDLQLPVGYPQKLSPLGHNWVKGKGLDNALPLGPWLVTSDEMSDPYAKRISLSVNGSVKQDERIGEMVFKIDQLIEYLSDGITLMPGDVISTGTPMGVAVFTGAPFLSDGDLVEAEIEGIGKLRNYVKKE